jgi:hypothetical protein
MALPISTSPDITSLDFSALLDISGSIPEITITNLSVGNPSGTTNLNLCTWWYTVQAPSGYYIHQGSSATPDFAPVLGQVATVVGHSGYFGTGYATGDLIYIGGTYTTQAIARVSAIGAGGAVATMVIVSAGVGYSGTLTELSTTTSGSGTGLAVDITLFNKPIWSTLEIPAGSWISPTSSGMCAQVEFNNSVPYIITLYCQDVNLSVFSISYSALLVQPNGLVLQTGNQQNTGTCGNFGVACFNATTICSLGQLQATDNTNYSYQGLQPATSNTEWIFTRPASGVGSYPTTSTVYNTQTALFYLYYDGAGFSLGLLSVCTYTLSANITVKIQYKKYAPLRINCNIDLCKLSCEYAKYIAEAERKCNTVENSVYQTNLTLINSYYNLVLSAISQPLCDIDVQHYIKKMSQIGGFNCGCGCQGVNPGSTVVPSSSQNILCVSIYQFGTTNTPPPTCVSPLSGWWGDPGLNIYDPIGGTIIGVAYSPSDMVSIINNNAAWQAFGTALNAGSCEICFIPQSGVLTIPPVYVSQNSTPNLNCGCKTTVFLPIVQHAATTTPTAQCPTCTGWSNNYVYNITNATQLGSPTVITSIAEAITLINLDSGWQAYGTAFDAGCCKIGFILNPSFSGTAPTFVAFLN